MTSPILTPNPLDTKNQYARFHHQDLPGLSDTDMVEELYALRPLLWGSPPDHWFRARVLALEKELAKRRGTSHEFIKQRTKHTPAQGVKL